MVRPRRTSTKWTVRKQVLSLCETKHNTTQIANLELYHDIGRNSGPVFGPIITAGLLRMNQGLPDTARIGDEIYVKGISVRLMIETSQTNVSFRIFVISGEWNDISNTSAMPPDLFRAEFPFRYFDYLNTERYKVLQSKTIKFTSDSSVESGATLVPRMRTVSMWIPFNRKVRFRGNNGTVPKYDQDNMAIGIIPYVNNASTNATNAGLCHYSWKCYYKDP